MLGSRTSGCPHLELDSRDGSTSKNKGTVQSSPPSTLVLARKRSLSTLWRPSEATADRFLRARRPGRGVGPSALLPSDIVLRLDGLEALPFALISAALPSTLLWGDEDIPDPHAPVCSSEVSVSFPSKRFWSWIIWSRDISRATNRSIQKSDS